MGKIKYRLPPSFAGRQLWPRWPLKERDRSLRSSLINQLIDFPGSFMATGEVEIIIIIIHFTCPTSAQTLVAMRRPPLVPKRDVVLWPSSSSCLTRSKLTSGGGRTPPIIN